jgi:hypothetical protein
VSFEEANRPGSSGQVLHFLSVITLILCAGDATYGGDAKALDRDTEFEYLRC